MIKRLKFVIQITKQYPEADLGQLQHPKSLTIITKRSILDAAAALDPPLVTPNQILIKPVIWADEVTKSNFLALYNLVSQYLRSLMQPWSTWCKIKYLVWWKIKIKLSDKYHYHNMQQIFAVFSLLRI